MVIFEEGKLPLKHHFEFPDFLFVFPQKSVFGVFVYDRFVLDELRPARVPESAQRLFIVII